MRTDNEEPGSGEATDEVEQVEEDVDEGGEEGGQSDKLGPAVTWPVVHHAADERDQAEHLPRHHPTHHFRMNQW